MIMTVTTLGSQVGFPAAAVEGGEVRGEGGGESGPEIEETSSKSTAPKARFKSRASVVRNGAQKISQFRAN